MKRYKHLQQNKPSQLHQIYMAYAEDEVAMNATLSNKKKKKNILKKLFVGKKNDKHQNEKYVAVHGEVMVDDVNATEQEFEELKLSNLPESKVITNSSSTPPDSTPKHKSSSSKLLRRLSLKSSKKSKTSPRTDLSGSNTEVVSAALTTDETNNLDTTKHTETSDSESHDVNKPKKKKMGLIKRIKSLSRQNLHKQNNHTIFDNSSKSATINADNDFVTKPSRWHPDPKLRRTLSEFLKKPPSAVMQFNSPDLEVVHNLKNELKSASMLSLNNFDMDTATTITEPKKVKKSWSVMNLGRRKKLDSASTTNSVSDIRISQHIPANSFSVEQLSARFEHIEKPHSRLQRIRKSLSFKHIKKTASSTLNFEKSVSISQTAALEKTYSVENLALQRVPSPAASLKDCAGNNKIEQQFERKISLLAKGIDAAKSVHIEKRFGKPIVCKPVKPKQIFQQKTQVYENELTRNLPSFETEQGQLLKHPNQAGTKQLKNYFEDNSKNNLSQTEILHENKQENLNESILTKPKSKIETVTDVEQSCLLANENNKLILFETAKPSTACILEPNTKMSMKPPTPPPRQSLKKQTPSPQEIAAQHYQIEDERRESCPPLIVDEYPIPKSRFYKVCSNEQIIQTNCHISTEEFDDIKDNQDCTSPKETVKQMELASKQGGDGLIQEHQLQTLQDPPKIQQNKSKSRTQHLLESKISPAMTQTNVIVPSDNIISDAVIKIKFTTESESQDVQEQQVNYRYPHFDNLNTHNQVVCCNFEEFSSFEDNEQDENQQECLTFKAEASEIDKLTFDNNDNYQSKGDAEQQQNKSLTQKSMDVKSKIKFFEKLDNKQFSQENTSPESQHLENISNQDTLNEIQVEQKYSDTDNDWNISDSRETCIEVSHLENDEVTKFFKSEASIILQENENNKQEHFEIHVLNNSSTSSENLGIKDGMLTSSSPIVDCINKVFSSSESNDEIEDDEMNNHRTNTNYNQSNIFTISERQTKILADLLQALKQKEHNEISRANSTESDGSSATETDEILNSEDQSMYSYSYTEE